MNSPFPIESASGAPAVAAKAPAALSDGLDCWIFSARVRLLYSGIALTAAANLINASILAAVHRNVVDVGIVVGWLTFMTASIGWRVWLGKSVV